MDDRTQLHQVSERERADIAAASRQPWHAPVIDIVPLKAAEASTPAGTDTGANFSC